MMDAKKIKIGWSSRDISPDLPVNLRGQFHARIAKEIRDPLTLTAMALESEDGSEQALMVSMDLSVVQNGTLERCREGLGRCLPDFDPEKMFINATHTHTAPAVPPMSGDFPPQADDVMKPEVYTERFEKALVEAGAEAWRNRQIGALSWGCGHALVGRNRRIKYLEGECRMYGGTRVPNFSHVEGYEDDSVDFLFTYNQNRQITGMIVNLACPAQADESRYYVTADFWHETRIALRERFGESLFIMPQCSAAGDQSPHPLLGQGAMGRMMRLKGRLPENYDKDQFENANRFEIADRIAAAATEVAPLAAKDIRDELVFQHKAEYIKLPKRLISQDDLPRVQEQLAKEKKILSDNAGAAPDDRKYSSAYHRVKYFQKVLDRLADEKRPDFDRVLPMRCHVLRLDEVAFATNQFELFLDYGLRIKERSKALQTFVVQLTGEYKYLPTKRAVASRNYGAGVESNLVGPDGGEVLVDKTVEMINDLFESDE